MDKKLDLQVAIPEFENACDMFGKLSGKIEKQCIDIISEICGHKFCNIIPVDGWQGIKDYDEQCDFIKENAEEWCGEGGIVFMIQCNFNDTGILKSITLHHRCDTTEIIYGSAYYICTKVRIENLIKVTNMLIKYQNNKY